MVNASVVYWGGVSFISWEEKDNLFPNVSSFLCRENPQCINQNIDVWALEKVRKIKFSQFQLSTDLISTNQLEPIILTPMITGESVSVVKDITAGNTSYIHVFKVFASLVVFEVSSGRFISAKPVVIQYTDTMDEPADKNMINDRFKEMLQPGGQINLFDELFLRGADLSPMTFSDKYVRVAAIQMHDEVISEIDSKRTKKAWETQIPKQFEAYLVENTNAPIVPSFSQDQITNELSATFANGSKVIKLPSDVPFEFNVEIEKLKELVKIDNRKKTNCHAVKIRLSVDGPFDTILDTALSRTKKSCGVISVDKVLDRNYHFLQSILSLLREASDNFKEQPDSTFFREAAPKSKGTEKKFSEVWRIALRNDW